MTTLAQCAQKRVANLQLAKRLIKTVKDHGFGAYYCPDRNKLCVENVLVDGRTGEVEITWEALPISTKSVKNWLGY